MKPKQSLGLENSDSAMLKGTTMSTVNNINPSLCLLNTENKNKTSLNSETLNNQMKQPKIANNINTESANMKSNKTNTITINQVSYPVPENVQKSINRYKRQSKDITYDQSVNFDGSWLPINNPEEYGAYRSILKAIHTQHSNMLTHYCKVFTMRFDLHFNPDDFNEAKVSDFLKRIKKEYRKTGKVMHAWAREIDSSDTPHYHCILAFNGNKVQNPIRVFNSIVNIWSGKLKQPRPHLCKEGNHMITNTHDNIFKDTFKRHSYLAKIKTKDRQPANKRNYGTSQIKPCIQKKLTG